MRCAVILALLALAPCAANAERMPTPMSALLRASVQLEVTVTGVTQDQRGVFGMGDLHLHYTARVDRVIRGAGFAPRQTIKVESVVLSNAPLTTGSSGDRSSFKGSNGLPLLGDRARLFAEGTPTAVRPDAPSGWQQIERRVAMVAQADDAAGQTALKKFVAALRSHGPIVADGFVVGQAHGASQTPPGWRVFDQGDAWRCECLIVACADRNRACAATSACNDRTGALPMITLDASAIEVFANEGDTGRSLRGELLAAAIRALNLGDTGGPSVLGMSFVPSGEFTMGSDAPESRADERPARRVRVGAYWIDRTEVTNFEFEVFAKATGYVTVAERPVDWEELKKQCPPGTPQPPAEMLGPGALVFTPPSAPVPFDDPSQWWKWTLGASWRHPKGPASDIKPFLAHPVVQVSYEDAAAYAAWAGKALPTEAQWERAARGGLDGRIFVWGDEPITARRANTWQGHFPDSNTKEDGYERAGRVASYPANGFGLFDMAGNVWEWCSDRYDPAATAAHADRVQRGGSFLCHADYCSSYRPSARMSCSPDTALEHLGFRCVVDSKFGESVDSPRR